ncbi:MAG: endonuclease/exonuclease/phosphatase family protein [Planctomycetota bacterium]
MLRAARAVALAALSSLPAQSAPQASSADRLRVLVWNVLHGANDVDEGPEKALRVIRGASPDLVLMQESYDVEGERPTLGRWIAAELGWQHHQADSPHLCVLTRGEITARFLHHPWHGVGVRVRDGAAREFVAYSIWIDYRAFLGYELRDDPSISDEDLLRAESVRSSRLPQTRALLAHLEAEGHLKETVPVLVGGDWNTPSHLDWTTDTARVFAQRRALPLPVSRAVHAAGFVDAFRSVHPNPVQRPGITWSPMFRSRADGKAQAFARIDRLYVKNPAPGPQRWRLEPVSAQVLPAVWEDEAIPTRQRAFPSDHGAVSLTLQWQQAR